MSKRLKEKVWELVLDMVDARAKVDKEWHEDEVQDIVDEIEGLAIRIEERRD